MKRSNYKEVLSIVVFYDTSKTYYVDTNFRKGTPTIIKHRGYEGTTEKIISNLEKQGYIVEVIRNNYRDCELNVTIKEV